MGGQHHQLKGAKPAAPHTNRRGGYQKGGHLVICDRSGEVYDSADVRKEWTGLIVGKDQWEIRHPQEFRRGIREDIAVKEARPGAPHLADLALTLNDVTAISGAVVGGIYTSAAATEARPFVYWTIDVGSALALSTITLAGLALSGAFTALIRRGLQIGYSLDDVSYTEVEPPVGDFGGGVTPVAASYLVPLNVTARYLRLALIDGKGLGFTGVLTQTGLTISRDV